MARTVQQIQTQITAQYVAAMAAIGITVDPTQWSRRNLQQLAINTFATGTAAFEQLYDNFTTNIELLISQAAPQTAGWFQAQMLKFQFDLTTPQILKFNTTSFYPYYPIVNTDLQVIKYCSVGGGAFGTILIKVAAQVDGAPSDLGLITGALDSATSYAKLLGVPNIVINVRSGNSDKLYLEANIYYQGGYSAIIQDTVIAGIEAYLGAIPFDGKLVLSDLELAIKAIAGVNDVTFINAVARPDGVAYGGGTILVSGSTTIARLYQTYAGYIVGETTATHTLADSLTFIPE